MNSHRALIERKNGCGDAEIGEPNCKLGAEGDSPRMIAYFMATAVIVLPANKNYAMLLEIYSFSAASVGKFKFAPSESSGWANFFTAQRSRATAKEANEIA